MVIMLVVLASLSLRLAKSKCNLRDETHRTATSLFFKSVREMFKFFKFVIKTVCGHQRKVPKAPKVGRYLEAIITGKKHVFSSFFCPQF